MEFGLPDLRRLATGVNSIGWRFRGRANLRYNCRMTFDELIGCPLAKAAPRIVYPETSRLVLPSGRTSDSEFAGAPYRLRFPESVSRQKPSNRVKPAFVRASLPTGPESGPERAFIESYLRNRPDLVDAARGGAPENPNAKLELDLLIHDLQTQMPGYGREMKGPGYENYIGPPGYEARDAVYSPRIFGPSAHTIYPPNGGHYQGSLGYVRRESPNGGGGHPVYSANIQSSAAQGSERALTYQGNDLRRADGEMLEIFDQQANLLPTAAAGREMIPLWLNNILRSEFDLAAASGASSYRIGTPDTVAQAQFGRPGGKEAQTLDSFVRDHPEYRYATALQGETFDDLGTDSTMLFTEGGNYLTAPTADISSLPDFFRNNVAYQWSPKNGNPLVRVLRGGDGEMISGFSPRASFADYVGDFPDDFMGRVASREQFPAVRRVREMFRDGLLPRDSQIQLPGPWQSRVADELSVALNPDRNIWDSQGSGYNNFLPNTRAYFNTPYNPNDEVAVNSANPFHQMARFYTWRNPGGQDPNLNDWLYAPRTGIDDRVSAGDLEVEYGLSDAPEDIDAEMLSPGVRRLYEDTIPIALRQIGAKFDTVNAATGVRGGTDWLSVNLPEWTTLRESQKGLALAGRRPLATR